MRPLARGEIDQAYPLVREVTAGLSLEEWRDYAARRISGDEPRDDVGGIVVAEAEKSYLRGLLAFHEASRLSHGHTLVIDHFAVPNGIGRRAVVIALIEAAQNLALQHHCKAIHVSLKAGDRWAIEALRDAGYGDEFVKLCWRID